MRSWDDSNLVAGIDRHWAMPGVQLAREMPVASLPSAFEQQRLLLAMQRAFSSTGGIATGDTVCAAMRDRCDQAISRLAKWIVGREVVSFDAGGQIWLPWFQFHRSSMAVQPMTKLVIGELRDVFDDWELAEWFAQPNAWLEERAPAEAIRDEGTAVLWAARADRYVATG